jgi:predicted small integral membrane protein
MLPHNSVDTRIAQAYDSVQLGGKRRDGMLAFATANGAKVFCILLAVLSWLTMAKQMQRDRLSAAGIRIILTCAAVLLFISYLGIKFQMQGFLSF